MTLPPGCRISLVDMKRARDTKHKGPKKINIEKRPNQEVPCDYGPVWGNLGKQVNTL